MLSLEALTPVVALHLLPAVVTILLSVVVSYWVWAERRDVRGVEIYLLIIVVAGILWQLQNVGQILTTNWSYAKFFVMSEKFLGFLASFLYVWFVAEHTNSDLHHERRFQAVSGFVVLGFPLLWATSGSHDLLVVDIVQVQEPFFHGSAVRGPMYFVFLVFTYPLVVKSILMLARTMTGTRRSVAVRVGLLTTGALGVGIGNTTSIAGLGPISTFQYGGYGAFPFLLATTAGIFRMGLFDIAPVARTTLVETLDDAVIVIDLKHRVVDYNERAVSLWAGLPDFEGRLFENACPELARQVAFTAGEKRTSQITLSIGGDTRHYSLLVSPVGRSGRGDRSAGYSLLLRDVTELENSRQQLQTKNQRLDQVAATISHDLRNPLTVADGYVDLLDAFVDDPEGQAHLDSLEESHARMAEIIEDVLTLARQGEEVTEREPVEIEPTARDAWANVATGNAPLEVEGDGVVMADETRLLTVFENLFRNAIEHGNGSVEVAVEVLGDGFAVTDDGSGIPPEKRDEVFDMGFSTAIDGTGFGLHIVEQIVDAHGWDVTVTEGESGGARFEFTGMDLRKRAEH